VTATRACRCGSALLAAGVLGLLGPPPIAADACGEACDDERGAQRTELEEIVVTATRHETALQDTSMSVAALSGADLAAMGARELADFFDGVAGLAYTEDGFNGYRIAIRGVATGTFLETSPTSALYVDETPMMMLASGAGSNPQYGGPRPQMVDIARVEVLRGPQGTLFGASSLGGAVRVVSNPPEVARYYGAAEATYSATAHGDSSYAFSGVVNLPIADGAALRLVGFRRRDGGYLDDVVRAAEDVNDAEISGLRAALFWRAAPNLQLTLRVHDQNRDTGGFNSADVGVGDYEQSRYVREYDDERWQLASFAAEYQLPKAQLFFFLSHLDREPRFGRDVTGFFSRGLGFFQVSAQDIRDSMHDVVHEVRVTSNTDGKLSWIGGLFYQDQDRLMRLDTPADGFDSATGGAAAAFGYPDNLFHALYGGALRQQAAYGEVAYRLSPAWEVTAGGRRFQFDHAIDTSVDGLFAGGPDSVRRSSQEHGFTPKVGVSYRPSSRVLVFVNAAEGYRPGGTNSYFDREVANCASTLTDLGIAVPPSRGYESDSLRNVELGAKTSWLDGRVTANSTLYRIRWKEMQTLRNINCVIDSINIIENVHEATSDGVELDVAWKPSTLLEVTAGVAYINARLTADAPEISGEAGEGIPTVPEWTASVAASTEFRLSDRVRGFARADLRYFDGSWSDFDLMLRRWIPSRQLLDMRLGAHVQRWELELFADNVRDERGVLMHANNVLGEWQTLMQPRTVGLRARATF